MQFGMVGLGGEPKNEPNEPVVNRLQFLVTACNH